MEVPDVIPHVEQDREDAARERKEQFPEAVPRDFQVTKEMLKKHGYSAACSKCRAIQEDRPQTKGHTPSCRQRIREQLEADQWLRDRVTLLLVRLSNKIYEKKMPQNQNAADSQREGRVQALLEVYQYPILLWSQRHLILWWSQSP